MDGGSAGKQEINQQIKRGMEMGEAESICVVRVLIYSVCIWNRIN